MKPVRAVKGHGFYVPRYRRWAYGFLRLIAYPYLRLAEGVGRIETTGMERLAERMTAFQAGDERLIILFRHVAKADAPVMAALLVRELPRWCRRHGIKLSAPPHAHFIYGKDVLNWAGAPARWLFPRVGGIPVVNTRVDRESQVTLRRLLTEGEFPLCFAPEGQVTYHMFRTAPPAAGTATLAAWAVKDLRARDDVRPVTILPVALGYLPHQDPDRLTRELLTRFNAALGRRGDLKSEEQDLDRELLAATTALADFMEASYAAEYPGIVRFSEALPLQGRLDRLCDTILRCGEKALGLKPQGTILERVFQLRYRIMDSLYREDLDPDQLNPLARSRADYRAQVAKLLKRHEETVDVLEYLRPDYLDQPGIQRRLEFVLNLLDVLNRLQGGNIDSRYILRNQTALVRIGEPIRLSDPPDRKGIRSLNQRVAAEFEALAAQMETELLES